MAMTGEIKHRESQMWEEEAKVKRNLRTQQSRSNSYCLLCVGHQNVPQGTVIKHTDEGEILTQNMKYGLLNSN